MNGLGGSGGCPEALSTSSAAIALSLTLRVWEASRRTAKASVELMRWRPHDDADRLVDDGSGVQRFT